MPVYVKKEDGSIGMMKRVCTNTYKIKPIRSEVVRIVGPHYRRMIVGQWFGISYDEIERMREEPARWLRNYYPLVDRRMTRDDCLTWLQNYGWGDTGKSACIGCPYRSDSSWVWLRETSPSEWRQAVDFDRSLRTDVHPNFYLHRSGLALDQVDLRSQAGDSDFAGCGAHCAT